ncbi:hypothetical protein [Acidovorax sp. sic0104]|uniref:hypothetical protein n=1 Tax=Acidovorax sp. sic0104 TaxID=2854784 RepID=UPI001C47B3FE|nr:hypothetical protein [Acidovorax sp. sic0104]MBV7543664.1 hypothetical protein [Acidovorax sp. sic0104]
MKFVIASALMLLAPAFALAQTPAKTESKPAAKSESKPAAKSDSKAAAKPAAKQDAKSAKSSEKAPAKKAVAKSEPTSSRTQLKSATNQVAAGIMAAEAALSPAELAIADRVHTGRIACELGAFVTVTAEPASPGHFHVEGKGFKYFMSPVATTTGTVRLEDQKGGAVWLQIANKSMLMNQKLGQRLADECMSPEQQLVAEAIKKNPPVSVLEPISK